MITIPNKNGDYVTPIYNHIVEDLQTLILSRFSSVKSFSEKNNFDRFTLSRIFQYKQTMSVGIYMRLCVSLGVLPPGSNDIILFSPNLTLYDYLSCQSFLVISTYAIILS